MQDPKQTHQDHDTRTLPAWYQKLSVGPLGPMGLCAVALGFIALLISGRLRMLYPMPRTVVASPQEQDPAQPIPPKPPAAGKAGQTPALRQNPERSRNPERSQSPEPFQAPQPANDSAPKR